MPNGISCAFFAAKNYVSGKKEQNIFKDGIAAAQTTRTVDAAVSSGALNCYAASPVTKFFGKAAGIARKIVYPLIIASGVYNTVKADDKVKTGASQVGGITTMYAFEQTAEKGLNKICTKLCNKPIFKNNKAARIGLYVLKGFAFVAASLSGYKIGSTAGENIVDKARKGKNTEADDVFEKESAPVEDNAIEVNDEKVESTLFADMQIV